MENELFVNSYDNIFNDLTIRAEIIFSMEY